jgi:hypothetical protein
MNYFIGFFTHVGMTCNAGLSITLFLLLLFFFLGHRPCFQHIAALLARQNCKLFYGRLHCILLPAEGGQFIASFPRPQLKLKIFPNFERPSKIAHWNFFLAV